MAFSFKRMWAVVLKEFIQMRRDRVTFFMMAGIPVVQLILFGYAINLNPKDLPTAVISADHSAITRRFLSALQHTHYFKIDPHVTSEAAAARAMAVGNILFTVRFPVNFTRRLIRGESPSILITGDATDPAAIGNALASLPTMTQQVFAETLKGPLQHLNSNQAPATLVFHRMYNPRGITQYNIVPGLMGVILTMTMVLITSLAITRENERNTMESLLATPVKPLEVMLGKVTPYIFFGYIQIGLVLLVSKLLFQIPIAGSVSLLCLMALPFIIANLAMGLTFSTIAKNQLQAVQMTFFFFLPSIILSGFMFPFSGMPRWAQTIGSCFPLTHFIRITREIMLKGVSWHDLWPPLWPILMFLSIVLTIGVARYRQTLD